MEYISIAVKSHIYHGSDVNACITANMRMRERHRERKRERGVIGRGVSVPFPWLVVTP